MRKISTTSTPILVIAALAGCQLLTIGCSSGPKDEWVPSASGDGTLVNQTHPGEVRVKPTPPPVPEPAAKDPNEQVTRWCADLTGQLLSQGSSFPMAHDPHTNAWYELCGSPKLRYVEPNNVRDVTVGNRTRTCVEVGKDSFIVLTRTNNGPPSAALDAMVRAIRGSLNSSPGWVYYTGQPSLDGECSTLFGRTPPVVQAVMQFTSPQPQVVFVAPPAPTGSHAIVRVHRDHSVHTADEAWDHAQAAHERINTLEAQQGATAVKVESHTAILADHEERLTKAEKDLATRRAWEALGATRPGTK